MLKALKWKYVFSDGEGRGEGEERRGGGLDGAAYYTSAPKENKNRTHLFQ